MLKIWACAKLDILFPCSFIMTNSTKAAAPQWAVHILKLRYWFSSEDRFSGGWEFGIVLPLITKSHIFGIIAMVYMYRRVITRLCGTYTSTVYLNADEQLYVKKPWIAQIFKVGCEFAWATFGPQFQKCEMALQISTLFPLKRCFSCKLILSS